MQGAVALSIALPKPGSLFGNLTHSLESRAIRLTLGLTAHLPGDPLTQALAAKFPGSVTRTSDSSWKMVDKAGRVFTARVSGTDLIVRGQDGMTTTHPIVPAKVSLPFPSLPKLPELPGVDVGKMVTGVADAAVAATMRQPAVGGAAIRGALRSQYPDAKVKYDGNSTWTVSNLGFEAPFQVKIRGNTVTAERNGRVLQAETISLRGLL
jgi:hypothetical protein